MMRNSTHQFFAPCPHGLEDVLADELVQLGAQAATTAEGGVRFSGDFPFCYKANLESRIASRVLWQIASGGYRDEDDIYKVAYDLPWTDWFDVGRTLMVKVSAQKCPLKSLDFITLKIKDAACDKFRKLVGYRPSIDTREPDVRIHAFLGATRFILYLDTSGEALFKRGLRKTSVAAPLRENLAAGILRLAGWMPGIPILDPMCGGGTFLLEAAQMALNIAPGIERNFAFEKLKNYDSRSWRTLRDTRRAQQLAVEPLAIYGSDLHGDALEAARENLAAAGLADAVHLTQADILEISAPAERGIMVTNPPYGVRIGEQPELAALYPMLGDLLKKRFAGWNAYIFTADMRLPKLIRLSVSRRIPLFNGALECRLYELKMVAGGMKRTTKSS